MPVTRIQMERPELSMDTQKPPPESDVIELAVLWRSLWGYKYLIAGAFLLCVGGAVALALSATPIYRAQAVLVEVEDPGGGGMASVVNQLGGLASLAGLNLSSGRGANGQSRAVLESRQMVEEFVGRDNRVALLSNVRGERATLWLAVKYFQENVVSIAQNARNGRITVSVEWKDPNVAAAWANEFVKLANERIRLRAIDEATRNISYLTTQIAKTNVVELQRVMYNIVQSETQTLTLANARAEYAFSVVDPAVAPEQRVRPKRTMMVAVGALLGLFLGLIVAIAHALFVRSRRESLKA